MVVGVRSSRIFVAWIALEVNLASFVVLIILSRHRMAWIRIKYFLIQRVGSAIFLFGGMVIGGIGSSTSPWVLILALFFKLAYPPFQFWLVNLRQEVSWEVFFLLTTAQKVIPLFLILNLFGAELIIFRAIGAAIAGAAGVFSNDLKFMLIYSSILRVSWMIGGADLYLGILVLIVYTIRILGLIILFYIVSAGGVHDLAGIQVSPSISVLSLILLLRMRGVPPTIGFYVKLMVAQTIITKRIFVLRVLLLNSLIFTWVYLRLRFAWVRGRGVSSRIIIRPLNSLAPILICALLFGPVPIFIYMCISGFWSCNSWRNLSHISTKHFKVKGQKWV